MVKMYMMGNEDILGCNQYFDLDQFMLEFYDGDKPIKGMSVNTFLEYTTKRIMDLEAKVDSISKALGIDEKPKSLIVSTDIDCQFGTKGDVE